MPDTSAQHTAEQDELVITQTVFNLDQAQEAGEHEYMWIGNKIYRTADLQRVFDTRIPLVSIEEGDGDGDDEGGGEEDG